jgi:hypothetical protein
MLVETAPSGITYFEIRTEDPPNACGAIGSGRIAASTMSWRTPGADGELLIRFFADNTEVEVISGAMNFCDADARMAGIYIRTEDGVRLGWRSVEEAQEQLNKLGYGAGAVDGIAGQRTRSAIADFQADSGLAATGELTLETLVRLVEDVASASSAAAAAARPGETGTTLPPAAPSTKLAFLAEVPTPLVGPLDAVYAGAVAPQRIDFADPPFEIAPVELDEAPAAGAREEIVVFWNDARFCGEAGCDLDVLRWNGKRYGSVLETVADDIALADTYSLGLRDLLIDGEPWHWNGTAYTQGLYQPTKVR